MSESWHNPGLNHSGPLSLNEHENSIEALLEMNKPRGSRPTLAELLVFTITTTDLEDGDDDDKEVDMEVDGDGVEAEVIQPSWDKIFTQDTASSSSSSQNSSSSCSEDEEKPQALAKASTSEGSFNMTDLFSDSNIKPDTPINVYARFCLSTAKSKFSLVSQVAD